MLHDRLDLIILALAPPFDWASAIGCPLVKLSFPWEHSPIDILAIVPCSVASFSSINSVWVRLRLASESTHCLPQLPPSSSCLQPDCTAACCVYCIYFLGMSLAGHCSYHWLLAACTALLLARVFGWASRLSLATCRLMSILLYSSSISLVGHCTRHWLLAVHHCRLCCQRIIVVLVVVITVKVVALAKVPLVNQAESSNAVVKFSFLVWKQQSLY